MSNVSEKSTKTCLSVSNRVQNQENSQFLDTRCISAARPEYSCYKKQQKHKRILNIFWTLLDTLARAILKNIMEILDALDAIDSYGRGCKAIKNDLLVI